VSHLDTLLQRNKAFAAEKIAAGTGLIETVVTPAAIRVA
jgi:hypothetical protein